ncbi:MAG: glutamine-hydrolyzing GMP synthase [Christensenellaceae bacterium]|nr:glutamine-hydrolyzing GMP synthase [Christensenellaceae bacterium]MEA5067078.1 glutamine-hydrolyzing GMP synthase [Eubacteriales bacterium]MEA5069222.1 glutamine-hydrolyzing GMP synthase [Christensenellaceae bacterium]
MKQDMIAILDLGSGENARIARLVRELGVYTEIHPHDIPIEQLRALPGLRGVIVNGGPNRIEGMEEIDVDPALYERGLPVLVVGHESPNRTSDLNAWPTDLKEALNTFIDRCGAVRNWNAQHFIDDQVAQIRAQAGGRKVLLALSGGVDSSVVAALLLRAIGQNLTCVHVNHGLLRKGEPEQVIRVFREQLGANLVYVDASDRFLDRLCGVSDPERKRKIIGEEFIRVFEEEARKLEGIELLAQGTIYPDIIESGTKTVKGVKAHHNVGGLPDDLQFELVEPLKMLFKDEVRACGEALGLPHDMVYRQPFPGPGLGVRCLGAITRERLEIVRESDAILREEFDKQGLAGHVWQYFTAVPDFKAVGVRGHARAEEYPVILRAVNTVDAMTAAVEPLPFAVLAHIADRILQEVPGAGRVLYDLSPKPPATIEWE